MSLVVAATLLFSPAAAQARFAGLVVRHDNRDISLVGLDSTFGGYYYADFLLACPEPCTERTRTFRAGTRMWPPILENQNRPRLCRLWLEITGLYLSSCLFCATGLRPIKDENLGVYRRLGKRRGGSGKADSHSPPDRDPSRNRVITGHRDSPRRSSDCDGACLSGFFWDINPVCLMWKEPISFAR